MFKYAGRMSAEQSVLQCPTDLAIRLLALFQGTLGIGPASFWLLQLGKQYQVEAAGQLPLPASRR